jgi:hypothetical protein
VKSQRGPKIGSGHLLRWQVGTSTGREGQPIVALLLAISPWQMEDQDADWGSEAANWGG